MEKKQQAKQTSLFDEEKLDGWAKVENSYRKFVDMLHSATSVTTTDFPTVQELEENFKERGLFIPLPTESVYQRSKDYYNRNIDKIMKVLVSSGLSETTIEVIKQDYFFALTGYYDFKAEPSQMIEAWEHLQPYFPYLFQIDRYGFYYVLMSSYYCYAKVFLDFLTEYKDGDEEKRKQYLEKIEKYSFLENRGVVWFMRRGVATPFDFTEKGLDFARQLSALQVMSVPIMDYVNYFTIAKYAYSATFDELRAIKSPIVIDRPQSKDEFFLVAQTESDRIFGLLSDKADRYAATADINKTEEEQEAAREEARKPIVLQYTFNRLSQQAASVMFDWQDKPINMSLSSYISDVWAKTDRGKQSSGVTVTEYNVIQSFGGIQRLLEYDKNILQKKPQNGLYTIPTNLNEFVEACTGIKHANDDERNKFLAALRLIDSTRFMIEKPLKKKKNRSGKTYYVGGITDVRLISLREYSETGGIVIDVYADVIDRKSKLLPVLFDDYQQMRKDAKSLEKRHFMEIMLGMDNIEEENLIEYCYSYDSKIAEAQKKADKAQAKRDRAIGQESQTEALGEFMRAQQELTKAKDNKRKHKSTARKNIRDWVKDYIEKGFITVDCDRFSGKEYTKEEGFDLPVKNIKTGKYVYFWYRGKKKKKAITEDAEVTEAETVSLPAPNQA